MFIFSNKVKEKPFSVITVPIDVKIGELFFKNK